MAVYVYSTGSIRKPRGRTARLRITVNNRSMRAEAANVIVWNTAESPKSVAEMFSTTLAANTTYDQEVAVDDSFDQFEVEVRLSCRHMAPVVMLHTPLDLPGEPEIAQVLTAGDLFADFAEAENV
ncbi:hypothetical protein [Paenibacillus cymbidii]|uniref:hypothetical protein n=1 Tax=Paenibacillus cymbidii TaxID=1639034 RepID=UPI00108154C7|nr:hypothetical protein [Paenibacillus cymbidii]